MFTSRHAAPMRLTLDDLELVVALAKQRAANGDESTRRVAMALDLVLHVRRAKAGVPRRVRLLPQVAPTACRVRWQAVARRCWVGMNKPLSLDWVRDPAVLVSQR